MGFEQVLNRMCKQVCVYWSSPVNDGEGGFTFDTPVELAVRWEEMDQLMSDAKGESFTSRAVVYVLEDLDVDGMLYLGELADLNSDTELDPKSVEGAYYIKRFEKSPSVGGNQFLRKAYLTPSLSFGGF
jgi:hypothetical protein